MKNPVFDKDLTQLLKACDNDDLGPIVQIILAAPSQTLTVKSAYRESPGNPQSYIDEIVYEITSFGGNSLANIVRGQGVSYAEMVRDVAHRLGLEATLADTTETLELRVILQILKIGAEYLDPDDKAALSAVLGNEEEVVDNLGAASSSLSGDRIQNAIYQAARSARIRSSLMGLVKSAVTRVATMSLGGPLSWALTVGQGVYVLFGPNYKTAIGLIAQIGLLRRRQQMNQEGITEIERELEIDG